MARLVEVKHALTIDDYAAVAHLSGGVQGLRAEAAKLVPQLRGRTIYMVNSTAAGGGVAEMLPGMISLLRDLDLDVRWLVMEADDPDFFVLTKKIHNLIHGVGDPQLSTTEKELYEAVSREVADKLLQILKPDDILAIHDPQPMGAGAMVLEKLDLPSIWRCHIGLDDKSPATAAAWSFLRPYADWYDRAIFSAPEYIPGYLAGRSAIIHPALDPLSHKNRELQLQKLVGILCDASLTTAPGPLLSPSFDEPAKRLQRDGSFAPATVPEDLGILYRPTIMQVSRWDRLKGFPQLLEAFRILKTRLLSDNRQLDPRHRRSLELARLMMVGPEASSVADDPEANEVLLELTSQYQAMPSALQDDVALIALPMESRKNNALMVNALQRSATIAVQNSVQEGFGLTATEAMWKRVPIIASRACGLRQQIRDGLDGRLLADPNDVEGLAQLLDEYLGNLPEAMVLARNAQRRVHDHFLVFTQLRRWLEELVEVVTCKKESRGQVEQPAESALHGA